MIDRRWKLPAGVGWLIASFVPAGAAVAQRPSSPPLAARLALTGDWELATTHLTTTIERLKIDSASGRLSGMATGGNGRFELRGMLTGQHVEFELLAGDDVIRRYTGDFRAGALSGRATLWDDVGTMGDSATWRADRPRPRPIGARIHRVVPRHFSNVFSDRIEPALRVFPGDTVATSTLDASGRDEQQVRRAPDGNPLTGPFFVEGALPGDALVVHFNRVLLIGKSAFSGSGLIGRAVLPGTSPALRGLGARRTVWRIDRDRNVAVASARDAIRSQLEIPLRPMVGCVGVAPPRSQAIASVHSGSHGGNLDYNRIGEGTTVYLPVYAPGALLFVGDGHATQGDGELTGDALETPLELQFTVDLIPAASVTSPRAEDRDVLMAIGIAGSLLEALQRATSDLAAWLASDYRLEPREIALLFGASLQYDVADLVGQQVSIVAKLDKSLLPRTER